jgi:hypothetical protein
VAEAAIGRNGLGVRSVPRADPGDGPERRGYRKRIGSTAKPTRWTRPWVQMRVTTSGTHQRRK